LDAIVVIFVVETDHLYNEINNIFNHLSHLLDGFLDFVDSSLLFMFISCLSERVVLLPTVIG